MNLSNKEENTLIQNILKNYFRLLIFGASGTGKSYLLTKKILPRLRDIYDEFVIFTRTFNTSYYLQQFKTHMGSCKPYIFTDLENILPIVEQIKEIQEGNIKYYDKDGVPVYKTNIIFVFDDVLSEKLFKKDKFLEIFVNLRHLQISTILCTQIANKAITTQMKANTNFFIIFRLGDVNQRRLTMTLIKECLLKKDPEKSNEKLKKEASVIYQKYVAPKYRYIVIDEFSELYK